ncbi:hypothetical protein ACFL2V_12790 [Pseudomonadota bacterium]
MTTAGVTAQANREIFTYRDFLYVHSTDNMTDEDMSFVTPATDNPVFGIAWGCRKYEEREDHLTIVLRLNASYTGPANEIRMSYRIDSNPAVTDYEFYWQINSERPLSIYTLMSGVFTSRAKEGARMALRIFVGEETIDMAFSLMGLTEALSHLQCVDTD